MKTCEEKIKNGRGTTNYPPDTHKEFCDRCYNRYNGGVCPETGTRARSKKCSV